MFNLISDIVNHNFFAVVHQVAYGCNLKWSLMSLIFQVILRLISKPASADIELTFGLKNYCLEYLPNLMRTWVINYRVRGILHDLWN